MSIYAVGEQQPRVHPSAFIHPDAVLIGNVVVGEQASIWPTAVLRGDFGRIEVGDRTSIQDGSVVHASAKCPTVIGADCVVGHNAHIEGAVIGAGCLIASMSTCLNEVTIGLGSMVAAGAVVTPRTSAPPHSRLIGAPARVSPIPDSAKFSERLSEGVSAYVANAQLYRASLRLL